MSEPGCWLLPEGVFETLPGAARRLEQLRRCLLDTYTSWGYELVQPPLIEFIESLQTDNSDDLDLQTFKITDQLTGRMMGIRADMTPQVARMEAHSLRRVVPNRLCYMGTVLRTRPLESGGSRSPLQIGAELYGHGNVESDVEVILLMLETLSLAGINDVLLDLGHVGIYRTLSSDARLNAEQEAILFDILQRKSVPDLNDFLQASDMDAACKKTLTDLCTLNGDESVLDIAVKKLPHHASIMAAIEVLKTAIRKIRLAHPDIKLNVDLAELRGYHYHTGLVFSAYSMGCGQSIVQGGRYDNISSGEGDVQPATGFSADLQQLVFLSGKQSCQAVDAIFAPCSDDAALRQEVRRLRAAGERVICALDGQNGDAVAMGCDRKLADVDGQWQVVPLAGR